MTGLVAKDATWATLQIYLDDIFLILIITQESCLRMGCTPDTDHRYACERSQMHVGRIHRHHRIEMTHQDEFLIHALAMLAHPGTLAILRAPYLEVFILVVATPKQEDAPIGVLQYQAIDYLLHQSWRINLALVGSKRGNTYPLLKALLRSKYCWQQVKIATLGREDRTELAQVDRIAQALEHSRIVLERCRQLYSLLQLASHKFAALAAILD